MFEPDVLFVLIVAAIGVAGGFALLYRMGLERDRIWGRYQQIKAAAKMEEELRRRREEASLRLAKPADLASDGGDGGEVTTVQAAGDGAKA